MEVVGGIASLTSIIDCAIKFANYVDELKGARETAAEFRRVSNDLEGNLKTFEELRNRPDAYLLPNLSDLDARLASSAQQSADLSRKIQQQMRHRRSCRFLLWPKQRAKIEDLIKILKDCRETCSKAI